MRFDAGAVFVLALLLRGLDTDVFEAIPEHIKDIYRLLLRCRYVQACYLVCPIADLSSDPIQTNSSNCTPRRHCH